MIRGALLFAAAFACCTFAAASTRLDDSLSPRQRVQTTTHWLFDGTGDWNEEQMNALVADVSAMEFRLRTAPYIGKNAEIYLTIPRQVIGLKVPTAMRIEWKTRGTFTPGTLVPWDRALVYRGKITQSVMSDFFDFRIFLDARTSERGIEFDPVFEIEIVGS
jgi:hypothetical protein